MDAQAPESTDGETPRPGARQQEFGLGKSQPAGA